MMKSITAQFSIHVYVFMAIIQFTSSVDFAHLRAQAHRPTWLVDLSDNRVDTLKSINKEKPVSSSSGIRSASSPTGMLYPNHRFKGCVDPSEPFQCPQSEKCVPLQFICDGNRNDCPGNLDENEEICIAVKRPAKENIANLLRAEYILYGSQLFAFLFGDNFTKKIEKDILAWIETLASALSVSKNINTFGTKLQLSSEDLMNFRRVVRKIHEGQLEEIPQFAQEAVNQGLASLIDKLNESGFMDE